MANSALEWAWRCKVSPSKAKLVLVYLADRYNEKTGQCNPSIARIAEACSMNRKRVFEALNILEKQGLITRVKLSKTSSMYALNMGNCSIFDQPTSPPVGTTSPPVGTSATSPPVGTSTSPPVGTQLVPPSGHEPKRTQREPKDPPYPPREGNGKTRFHKSTRRTTLEEDLNDTSWAH